MVVVDGKKKIYWHGGGSLHRTVGAGGFGRTHPSMGMRCGFVFAHAVSEILAGLVEPACSVFCRLAFRLLSASEVRVPEEIVHVQPERIFNRTGRVLVLIQQIQQELVMAPHFCFRQVFLCALIGCGKLRRRFVGR